jgi:hypothetical protein
VDISISGALWATLTSPAATGTFQQVFLYLNTNTADSRDFALRASYSSGAHVFKAMLAASLSIATDGSGYVNRFASTGSIDNSTFADWTQFTHPLWGASTWQGGWDQGMGYIGIRESDGSGGYTYGWVQITPDLAGGYKPAATLNDWSAATASSLGGSGSGTGSGGGHAPAGTPEPAAAGLALLALGAAGVLRQRRRGEQTA